MEVKIAFLDTGGSGQIHTIGDAVGKDYWYTVRIVTSETWRITGASVYIRSKTGDPGTPFYFRLETDSAGHPSGTLVHANAAANIASPVVGAWNRVNFTPFSLAAGTYYLVVYVPDQPNDNSWNIDRHENGIGRRGWSTNHGASWSMYDNAYIPYHRIYGEALAPPPPPPPLETLRCPLCGLDLEIPLQIVERVEIVSSPVIDQLLADIAKLDAKVDEIRKKIGVAEAEIAKIKEILGL